MPSKTYVGRLTGELLKKEIDRLKSEQQKEIDNAIYLGLTPEKAEELAKRRALIKTLSDELYGLALNNMEVGENGS